MDKEYADILKVLDLHTAVMVLDQDNKNFKAGDKILVSKDITSIYRGFKLVDRGMVACALCSSDFEYLNPIHKVTEVPLETIKEVPVTVENKIVTLKDILGFDVKSIEMK